MNALKHGRRSRQFAELGALIAQSPIARDALLNIAGRWEMEKGKADYVAARILATMITRGLKRGADGLTVLPPDADGRSIPQGRLGDTESALDQPSPKRESSEKNLEDAPHNQKPSGTPANNQSQTQNRVD